MSLKQLISLTTFFIGLACWLGGAVNLKSYQFFAGLILTCVVPSYEFSYGTFGPKYHKILGGLFAFVYCFWGFGLVGSHIFERYELVAKEKAYIARLNNYYWVEVKITGTKPVYWKRFPNYWEGTYDYIPAGDYHEVEYYTEAKPE